MGEKRQEVLRILKGGIAGERGQTRVANHRVEIDPNTCAAPTQRPRLSRTAEAIVRRWNPPAVENVSHPSRSKGIGYHVLPKSGRLSTSRRGKIPPRNPRACGYEYCPARPHAFPRFKADPSMASGCPASSSDSCTWCETDRLIAGCTELVPVVEAYCQARRDPEVFALYQHLGGECRRCLAMVLGMCREALRLPVAAARVDLRRRQSGSVCTGAAIGMGTEQSALERVAWVDHPMHRHRCDQGSLSAAHADGWGLGRPRRRARCRREAGQRRDGYSGRPGSRARASRAIVGGGSIAGF